MGITKGVLQSAIFPIQSSTVAQVCQSVYYTPRNELRRV